MAKVRALRELIYGKFDSESDFARYLGWQKQRLSKITNGKKLPDINEINAIAVGLNKSVESIANIFLRLESPNEQHQSRRVG